MSDNQTLTSTEPQLTPDQGVVGTGELTAAGLPVELVGEAVNPPEEKPTAIVVKKSFNWLPYAIVLAVLFGYFGVGPIIDYVHPQKVGPSPKEIALTSENDRLKADALAIKQKEEADQELGKYALRVMQLTSARHNVSAAAKQVLAQDIVRVADNVFDKPMKYSQVFEQKKAIIGIIAIESAFQRLAVSKTGPRGYGQVGRAALKEGLGNCGVTEFNDEDAWDTTLNLTASACYFRSLLEATEGDIIVSLIAYNQGPNSETAKKFALTGTLEDKEALQYLARFSWQGQKASKEEPKKGK